MLLLLLYNNNNNNDDINNNNFNYYNNTVIIIISRIEKFDPNKTNTCKKKYNAKMHMRNSNEVILLHELTTELFIWIW